MSVVPDYGEWPTETLPANWVWASFADAWLDYTDSLRKLPKKAYQPAGRFAVVDQGEDLVGGFSDDEGLLSHAPRPCIVWGDHTKCVKYIDHPFVQGADGVKVLATTGSMLPEFAHLALKAIALPDKGYSRHFKFLRASRYPVPPLAEQHRIVAKLDSLFARTRSAREELARIPRLIEHYKQAILAAAFRGELTADWRAERGQASVPSEDMPSSWNRAELKDIAEVQSGLALGKKRNPAEDLREVPYLRVANVQRGYFDLSEIKTVRATEQEIARLLLKEGDILMNEGGDRDKLGRGWVWSGKVSPCIHQNHVFRIRLHDPEYPPRYVSYFANAFGQRYFFAEGKQTTNLASISKTKVSSLPVPLAPAQEAVEIVSRLEAALTEIVRIDSEATRAAALLDHLDYANLAKAFRGELVPQDPNDEPAAVLLERIRAARAAEPKRRRRKATPDTAARGVIR